MFEFVNDTVEDWFEQCLGMPFNAFHMEHGFGNPVVRTECEFLRPCRFGEELTFEFAPTHIGRSSMEFRILVRGRGRGAHAPAASNGDDLDGDLPADGDPGCAARARRDLPGARRRRRAAGAARRFRPQTAPPSAFRSHQLVRYGHCDPGRIVYFPRFFDMLDAALEDWFATGLGAPWASDLIGARNLHATSLAVALEFKRACRLGEQVDFDLWPTRLGRSSFDLALAASVAGEERLRAGWTLCVVSHDSWKSVPIPGDLRARMQDFLPS